MEENEKVFAFNRGDIVCSWRGTRPDINGRAIGMVTNRHSWVSQDSDGTVDYESLHIKYEVYWMFTYPPNSEEGFAHTEEDVDEWTISPYRGDECDW